jgi:uncharacterized membrane protein SpoIIM required for sporulation
VTFTNGARAALRVAIGLIPFFFLAAFFEGFVTRFTEMSDIGRMVIIFGSLIFVLWYFVALPYIAAHRVKKNIQEEPERSVFMRVLVWFSIVITSPFSPVALALIKIKQGNERVSVLEYLTSLKMFNPITRTRIFMGLLLFLLPTIAILMQAVTGKGADMFTYIFFGFCYSGGLSMIIWAAYNANRYEEDDLNIDRQSRVKESVYESKGTSVKV